MRILKWISWGLAGLCLLILVGLLVLVWVIDPNGFKPTIEARVKQATGRELQLSGKIELGFFPWLAVRTGAGSFANAPGFGTEPMASWRSAQFGARLLPLLGGEIVIDRVKLDGAEVRLVRHADGTANWQGIGASGPAAPVGAQRHVTIDGVDLTDSHLLFVDEASARRIEIGALRLTTDAIAPDQPFTDTKIAGVLHMEGFDAAGVPFRLEVPVAALTQELLEPRDESLSRRVRRPRGEGSLYGSFGGRTRMSGSFASNIFDARALLASLGVQAPKTTDARALTRIVVRDLLAISTTGR